MKNFIKHSFNRKTRLAWIAALLGFGLAVWFGRIDSLPQSAYQLLDPIAPITAQDRVMVVAPHQDDDVLGAGGLIQQARSAGAPVKVVWATDGNKHRLKAERESEARSAMSELGLSKDSLVFLGFRDATLQNDPNFPAILMAEIEQFKPTIVVTTLAGDHHPDHAACGEVVGELQQQFGYRAYYFLIHFTNYPQPFGSDRHSYLLPPLKLINANNTWRVLPLTKEQLIAKEKALKAYRTQLSLKNPFLKTLLWSFIRQNELFLVKE
jgi:LmbE family N-acetylglucosaminyl deacetylase